MGDINCIVIMVSYSLSRKLPLVHMNGSWLYHLRLMLHDLR